ncbi:3-oxoadipate CoA-transferase subunit A [Gluconacetobacter liquefaciens]|uniref:3-oxoadipate CoA-transferase alpha subunit n=3 Tax=Gluconacetobacter TaxID=89583 RepID=A0A370G222_GLULI|nr:3-oxoadipate CoA-transferase alpha subunit [Gluconacetobacter liquefaciens]GBQ94522.1 3-oxoadipate CoA-transferase subunit A [Gluconacetobacter liquefaciens NRIC 0522]GEB38721.1 3-oxoadipate CoA-transferase subunit A [Gluconacetobacter liquefaciens]
MGKSHAEEGTGTMINKEVRDIADALSGIGDGAVVMVGGFGSVGQPDALIEGLIEQGARDLTIIANNAGAGRVGLARLMEAGRVRKIICSFPRSAGSVVFEELFRAGKLELEIVPQGTLAERIRAAGAGIPGFYTATTVGTLLAQGKETRTFDGRTYVLEHALHADVALVEAWRTDRMGNCTYRESGRNFNAVMAMAARMTVVQSCGMVAVGALDPEMIVTPGIFVDRIVVVPEAAKVAAGAEGGA